MTFADQISALAAEYQAAADYSVSNDCTKARQFEVALRRLLMFPQSAFHAGESITFAPQTWHALLRDVQSWIAAHCGDQSNTTVSEAGHGGAIHFDTSEFRR